MRYVLQASTLIGPPPMFFWMIAAFIALVAMLSVLAALRASGRRDTPDHCWKAGAFYVNPDDSSLFVPKRFGIGYTVNFAHPWSGVVLAVVILVSLLPVIFALLVLHRALPIHR